MTAAEMIKAEERLKKLLKKTRKWIAQSQLPGYHFARKAKLEMKVRRAMPQIRELQATLRGIPKE